MKGKTSILALRRQALAWQVADLSFPVGMVGRSEAFYAAAYRPGRRSAAWRNIKPGRNPQ